MTDRLTNFYRTVLLAVVAVVPAANAADAFLNIADRETAWAHFTYNFFKNRDAVQNWTGSMVTFDPGTVSPAFEQAVLDHVNYYRDAAGLPRVTLNGGYSRKARLAAMVMQANPARGLSHSIDSTWIGYSADAADGALASNLDNYAGPASVDRYIEDEGSRNTTVGHRVNLFYLGQREIGTGDVLADQPRNALYVSEDQIDSAFREHRERFTAWPAPGYNPAKIIPKRWSFTIYPGDYPSNDSDPDSRNANVSVTLNGVPIAVTVVARTYLENKAATIVWEIPDTAYSSYRTPFFSPDFRGEWTYHVEVSGVVIRNAFTNATSPLSPVAYDVKVFSPEDGPTAPAAPQVSAAINVGTTFHVGGASSRRLAVYTLAPDGYTNPAETAFGITTTVTRAPLVEANAGVSGSAFALPVAENMSQTFTLKDRFVPDSSSSITWQSRFLQGTAGSSTSMSGRLLVEANAFDGQGWRQLAEQSATATTGYSPRTVSLAALAGREVSIRFRATYHPNSLYNDLHKYEVHEGKTLARWHVDDISVSGRHFLEYVSVPIDPAAGANWVPSDPGVYRVAVGARYFNRWDAETGATSELIVAGASSAPSVLANLSIRSVSGEGSRTLIMGFVTTGGTKGLLARGIGPSLKDFGIGTPITDPKLTIFREDHSTVTFNDNWGSAAANPLLADTQARVGAFGLIDGAKDAALMTSLPAGLYTAHVVSVDGSNGVAMAELYDTDTNSPAHLVNVSARSYVGTGEQILIAGLVIVGDSPKKLLIRGIGPGLKQYGVDGVLEHPLMKVHAGQTVLYANQKWGTAALNPEIIDAQSKSGAFGLTDGSNDAALVVTLMPGLYTVTVSGSSDNETGVAMIEVYDLDSR